MPSPRRVPEVVVVLVVLAMSTLAMGIENREAATQPLVPLAPWLDTDDRAAVVGAYGAEFSAAVPEPDWEGSHDGCEAGSTAELHRRATVRRVNFYRAMAGVPADVAEDADYSSKAQRAAIMMSAEGTLTHSPTPAFACFTPIGQEAAANSNLYLGRNGPRAVDGYIEDPGDRNIDVGHRATILHPPTRRMGVGDVETAHGGSSANALWVFDDRVFDETSASLRPPMRERDRFVAWPPRGYVPADLVHPRWSFTMAGVDLSEAEVAMYRPAEAGRGLPSPLPLRVVNRSGAVGHVPLPTIVWEPEPGVVGMGPPVVDELYLVVVTGVDRAAPAELASVDRSAATTDGNDRMVGAGSARRSFAYAVRIIGNGESAELTVGEFLARLGGSGR